MCSLKIILNVAIYLLGFLAFSQNTTFRFIDAQDKELQNYSLQFQKADSILHINAENNRIKLPKEFIDQADRIVLITEFNEIIELRKSDFDNTIIKLSLYNTLDEVVIKTSYETQNRYIGIENKKLFKTINYSFDVRYGNLLVNCIPCDSIKGEKVYGIRYYMGKGFNMLGGKAPKNINSYLDIQPLLFTTNSSKLKDYKENNLLLMNYRIVHDSGKREWVSIDLTDADIYVPYDKERICFGVFSKDVGLTLTITNTPNNPDEVTSYSKRGESKIEKELNQVPTWKKDNNDNYLFTFQLIFKEIIEP